MPAGEPWLYPMKPEERIASYKELAELDRVDHAAYSRIVNPKKASADRELRDHCLDLATRLNVDPQAALVVAEMFRRYIETGSKE